MNTVSITYLFSNSIETNILADGIEVGLEWRLPKWIKVEEHETKPGHLVITMEEVEFGLQRSASLS